LLQLCEHIVDHLDGPFVHSEDLIGLFGNFVEETAKHFQFEDQLLASYGHPDAVAHRVSHVNYLDNLKEIGYRFSIDMVSKDELIQYVLSWMNDHMRKLDAVAFGSKA
jgi:hemerythrin